MNPRAHLPLMSAALALALVACTDDSKPRLYRNSPLPPEGLLTDVPLARIHEAAPGDKTAITEDGVRALHHLGPSLMQDAQGVFKGINFSVYSLRAEKVRLLLFDDPESNRPTREFDMTRFGNEVWNVYVEGVGLGQHYGYIAWGPNWTEDPRWYPGSIFGYHSDVDTEGNRFNPNKLLFDPYCKAFHRDHDWSKGSVGSGPDRVQNTYGAAMKCVVIKSQYAWGPEEQVWREARMNGTLEGHGWNELVYYEVHPKGFTANSSSGVVHSGTFRGFGEKADYLKDLGINAVELMPVMEKALDGGYWGYNTLSFFAPEISYASKKEQAEVIDEFKFMVEELHKRGIEVVLDVVYNHTGEGGLWRQKIYAGSAWDFDPQEVASIFSYRGLDNWSYYALNAANRGYSNNTGVGNEMRCNNAPMRRLTLDSVRYWVEEMHVDGFRFDLAPVLGEKDLEYWVFDDPANTVLQEIIEDPVLQKYNTRIIAEPWGGGGGGFQLGKFTAARNRPGYGWGEWNSHFRDWWRSFVNSKGDHDTDGVTHDEWNWSVGRGIGDNDNPPQRWLGQKADGGFVMAGSEGYFKTNGRKPYHSLNFVTIHDGMTMYDLLSYDRKVNDCGPLNPVCCEHPLSPYCEEAKKSGEWNNRSRNWGMGAEDYKRQLMRTLYAAMFISHGTPMLFGGDEWLRTQLGNNNTYTPEADNPYSWFDWGTWQSHDERHRMFDYVKKLIRLRKEHVYALSPAEYGGGAPFTWKSASNGAPEWGAKTMMIHYHDASAGPELAILINMAADATTPQGFDVTFQLPSGRRWYRLLDTRVEYDTDQYLAERALPLRESANATLDAPEQVGPTYPTKGRTIVVLEAR